MAVHRPSPGGMAQCSDLFDPDQLPAARPEPAGISPRCAGAPAVGKDHSHPRTPPRPLETPRGEQFMKCRVGSARFRGGTMQKPYTDKQGQYLAFIYYYSKIHGR